MEANFAKICKEIAGIQTRIVSVNIALEYEEIENEEKFIAEYTMLDHSSDNKHLQNLIAKNKNEEAGEAMMEILVEIYQKLINIENQLLSKKQNLIPLKNNDFISALGHGIICIKNANLIPNQDYYMRLKMPIFPERVIGIFAKAFHEEILKITKMHTKDIQDFDAYIAKIERENLKHNKQG